MERGELILVIGGARSGKSAFAEKWARARGNAVLFVATAEAYDEEMAERIAKHRAQRPAQWQTLEAPRGVAHALHSIAAPPKTIVLDCLTLWTSNELLAAAENARMNLERELDAIMEWQRAKNVDLLIVSNEVGLGIVPDNALARAYRDLLGSLNQRLAQAADKVYWMVAGLPIEIKRLALAFDQERRETRA